jgi:PAS domain S-box-containing protein
VLLVALVLLALYYSSLYNILLFHSLVEIFRVVVAAGVFVVAYNTRHLHRNGGLVLLGVAYLHVAALDLLHTLSYQDMGVFPLYDSNLPTQLWVAARLLQNVSFLLALTYFGRRARLRAMVPLYFGITALLIFLIFAGHFPAAYVVESGLTPFKIASEYVVMALSLLCIVLLLRRRGDMTKGVFSLLLGALVMDALASMSFTRYGAVTDTWLVVGHYAILASYFLLYKAIVETGLRRPFDLLFHNLRQRERALREHAGLLRSVVAGALVGLFATDERGVITVMEGHDHQVLGMGPQHDVGSHTLSAPEGSPLADNVARALAGETVTVEVDAQDGRTLYVRYAPLSESGRVAGVIGVASDVTEIKRAEEALRVERNRAQRYLDVAADIIVTIDVQENVTLVNRRACELFGYAEDEVVGMNWFDTFFPDAMREQGRQEYRRILTASSADIPYYYESPIRTRSGAERYIAWRVTLLAYDEGPVYAALVAGTDITERKQAEEMSRRVALAARVREVEEGERRRLARELHDQVGGNLSLLGIHLNIVRSRLAQECADHVASRIDDSLSLVDQTAQSIRSVMSDLRPPVLDDYGLAAALRWYSDQFTSSTGISITIQADENGPRPSTAVEVTLFRIAQEALANVARHAQASQVTVRLTQSKRSLRLFICDDGIGFDTADSSAPDSEGGWGLLNMAERAQAVGGQCRIESEPGRGTCITVRVPWQLS